MRRVFALQGFQHLPALFFTLVKTTVCLLSCVKMFYCAFYSLFLERCLNLFFFFPWLLRGRFGESICEVP